MANKRITVDLSKESLKRFKKNMEEFQKKLEQAPTKIVDEASEFCLNEMQKNYAESTVTAESSTMSFSKTGTDLEKKVSMIGTQAIYHEYGTGTVGERNPHPNKEGKGLKDYNSGRTIRKVTSSVAKETGYTEGELYWTYQGKPTQGIAPQKVVYNAGNTTIKQSSKIIKKTIDDLFNTLD